MPSKIASCRSPSRQINLVEYAAVAEKLGLRFFPSAEITVDREKRQRRKLAGVLGGDLRIARTIKILRADLLSFGRVQKFQIRLRDRRSAVAAIDLIHPGDRRFGLHTQRRIDNFESVRAE